MTDVGELTVRIRADAAQLDREMRRANAVVAQSTGAMGAAFGGLKAQLLSLVPAVSALGLVSFGKHAVDTAGHIVDLADRIGFAASTLSALEIPLAASGASLDEFTGSVNRMNNILGEAANGGEQAIRAFDSIGLSVDRLRALSPEEQFYEIATALGQIKDQSTQTEAGMNIFGRGFAVLLPLLKEYEGDMRKAVDAQKAMDEGLDASLKRVDAFGDAMSTAAIKVEHTFIKALAAVLKVSDAINEVLEKPSVNAKWNMPGDNSAYRYGPHLPKGTVSEARPRSVEYAVFGGAEQYGPSAKSNSARGSNSELYARIKALQDAQKETSKNTAETRELVVANDELSESMREAARFQQQLHDRLSASLTDVVFRANSATDAMLGFADSIARAAFEKRVAGPLADALIGTGGGKGLLDDTIGGVGKFFGGFFADGGRPPVGVPSVVGERGPEIFMPDAAGTVIPNHKIGGASTTVNHVWNIQSGVTRQELASIVPVIERRATAATLAAMQGGGTASRITGLRN